jgi:nitrogen fixation/metabolism regulation signal transduction histidine kinase
MRKRLWFSIFAVAVVAVLVPGVPALVASARHDALPLAATVALIAGTVALAAWLASVLATRLARPVEELADAAGRLAGGTG